MKESEKTLPHRIPDEPVFICCEQSQFIWRCDEHEWSSDGRCYDGSDKHPYDPEASFDCPICGKTTNEGHWMWIDNLGKWKCEGSK